MELRNFPLVVTISTAVATIFYTKKRIKRAKLKAVHAKHQQPKSNN